MARKYGEMESAADVTRISEQIRKQIASSKSPRKLERLMNEQQYLYTLTFSPSVKKALYGRTLSARNRAKSEFTKTANAVNRKLRQLGYNAKYDTKLG